MFTSDHAYYPDEEKLLHRLSEADTHSTRMIRYDMPLLRTMVVYLDEDERHAMSRQVQEYVMEQNYSRHAPLDLTGAEDRVNISNMNHPSKHLVLSFKAPHLAAHSTDTFNELPVSFIDSMALMLNGYASQSARSMGYYTNDVSMKYTGSDHRACMPLCMHPEWIASSGCINLGAIDQVEIALAYLSNNQMTVKGMLPGTSLDVSSMHETTVAMVRALIDPGVEVHLYQTCINVLRVHSGTAGVLFE